MSTPMRIIALPGDGIGPEVTEAALRVLDRCVSIHSLDLQIERMEVGGKALDSFGEPLPPDVLTACKESGIVFLGAVGDSRFDENPSELRPEAALLRLRSELGLYANLRPIAPVPSLLEASPIKKHLIEGTDILIVRELTGGIYFGEPRGVSVQNGKRVGINTEVYDEHEIERIARIAFEASRIRKKELTSVDKSNVLESSRLWRSVVSEVGQDYRDVSLSHMLVDNCAMQLVAAPRQFDVLLTSNMFGDILSDEAAILTGSIGMLPSASLGELKNSVRFGMYEPVHGTAPDIAGQDKANPLAAIGSLALLFRFSLSREDIAADIESALNRALLEGHRTLDTAQGGQEWVGTQEMTERVLSFMAGSSSAE